MLLCGAETWKLLRSDKVNLKMFEREIMRNIFEPVRVGDEFRIRTNRKQCDQSFTNFFFGKKNVQNIFSPVPIKEHMAA